MMPLFKVWDITKTKKKAVMANSIQELITKGKTKLDITEEITYVYEEDGTEIDDDDCLLAHDPGTVFILGSNFETESAMPKADTAAEQQQLRTSGGTKRMYEGTSKGFCDPEADVPNNSTVTSSLKSEIPNTTSVDIIMKTPYRNAKLRNLKIFSEKEIASPKSPLESKRRRFWNEKAEQLATKNETWKLDKPTIGGIIDVSWTLRKTSLIEVDARKILNDESVITGCSKTGSQKRLTIPKNLDRMEKAHVEVECLDKEIAEIRQQYEQGETKTDKQLLRQKYEGKKIMLDGAYTELKKAQEALTKALKEKKKELEKCSHSDSSEN